MAEDIDITGLEEQLADARVRIESLEAAAADAAARAATARAQAEEARLAETALAARIAEIEENSRAEAEILRAELAEAHGLLREAAAKYRAARLEAASDVPGELVPETESIEEVDREIEAAKQLVERVRQGVEERAELDRRSARVPAASPGRRAPDYTTLSADEKIRLGLQQHLDREGR